MEATTIDETIPLICLSDIGAAAVFTEPPGLPLHVNYNK